MPVDSGNYKLIALNVFFFFINLFRRVLRANEELANLLSYILFPTLSPCNLRSLSTYIIYIHYYMLFIMTVFGFVDFVSWVSFALSISVCPFPFKKVELLIKMSSARFAAAITGNKETVLGSLQIQLRKFLLVT